MQDSAAFQPKFFFRDLQAGIITGTMAILLTVGIAMMSEYPIMVALATVVLACFIVAGLMPGSNQETTSEHPV
jgi:MFS superfamily sulfate permease-like transporter